MILDGIASMLTNDALFVEKICYLTGSNIPFFERFCSDSFLWTAR